MNNCYLNFFEIQQVRLGTKIHDLKMEKFKAFRVSVGGHSSKAILFQEFNTWEHSILIADWRYLEMRMGEKRTDGHDLDVACGCTCVKFSDWNSRKSAKGK